MLSKALEKYDYVRSTKTFIRPGIGERKDLGRII